MLLVWLGKYGLDGFDETGTRVASVVRCRDPVPGYQARYKPYWAAFVFREDFDYVMVDGQPGRWATEGEAKAAAEAAHAAWRAEAGERADVLRARPPEPKPLGFGASVGLAVRSLLKMLLPVRRRRRTRARHDDTPSSPPSSEPWA